MKEKTHKNLVTSFSLDGSSHQIKGAAFNPPDVPKLTALECQHRLTQLTQHVTHENLKKHFALCKKTLSPAKHALEDTSHQTRPEIDAGDASLLMGSVN
jgi:hypothetical protein